MEVLKDLFLKSRLFLILAGLILGFLFSYAYPLLLPMVQTAIVLLFIALGTDIYLTFNKTVQLQVNRLAATVLSLGDDNVITLEIFNRSNQTILIDLIDELPEQLQQRNFNLSDKIPPQQQSVLTYLVRPLSRGEYQFGKIHIFITSPLQLVKRKMSYSLERSIPVYPSIIQLKKYELHSLPKLAQEYGIKKVRRIGHSYEFEHIKQYNRGDDYRSINWKATGRRAQLMVNQYEDERSQQVYCIIDKSRVMHMPFHGLSLFDYAVNASLVISNIVLSKQDKAGLITFAEKTKAIVKADRSKVQLKKILDTLYNEKEGLVEANYEHMYLSCRNAIKGRSLLFLYTNFESSFALERALPQLRKLNKQHLVVVVFFENTEIAQETSKEVKTLADIYTQVTAEHYAYTKIQLVQQLRQLGIMSILTKPEELTINSINKYLELKSRGMI